MAEFLQKLVSAVILIIPAWAMVIMGMYVSQDFFRETYQAYSIGFLTSIFMIGYATVVRRLYNKNIENNN